MGFCGPIIVWPNWISWKINNKMFCWPLHKANIIGDVILFRYKIVFHNLMRCCSLEMLNLIVVWFMEEISRYCGGSPQVSSSENSIRDESRPSNDGYLDQTNTFVNPTIGSMVPIVIMKQFRGRPLLIGWRFMNLWKRFLQELHIFLHPFFHFSSIPCLHSWPCIFLPLWF